MKKFTFYEEYFVVSCVFISLLTQQLPTLFHVYVFYNLCFLLNVTWLGL